MADLGGSASDPLVVLPNGPATPAEQATDDIASRIREMLPQISGKQRLVGRMLLEDPYLIAYTSASEVADQLGINTATVVRATQSFGFEGWRHLQQHVRDHMRRGSMFENRISSLEGVASDEIIERMRTTSIDAISRALSPHQIEQLASASSALVEANRIYVVGGAITTGIAQFEASTLRLMGLPAHLITDAETASVTVSQMSPGDVMIVFGVRRYLRWIVEAARFVHARGVTVVPVTDSEASPLVFASTAPVVVRCQPVGPRANTVGLLAVAHVIAALVGSLIGDTQKAMAGLYEQFTDSVGMILHDSPDDRRDAGGSH